ncbi:uncharacterized protein [Haliotis cracherodii]|uniref:uncharacterized protein n=1 Tax=Haliotis cracherodii TaxID=6455 RepID=UPI0039ED1BD3
MTRLDLHLLYMGLSVLPMLTSAAPLSNNAACNHKFNHSIQRCMEAFQDLYQSQQQENGMDHLIVKHLCLEYEKTLQCMHSALTSCPTPKNIQRVQHKLGADWVMGVNQLCRIQSESRNDEGSNEDEMDYLPNTTKEESQDSKQSDEAPTPNSVNERLHDNNLDTNELPKSVKRKQVSFWSKVIRVRRLKTSRDSPLEKDNIEYKFYNILTKDTSSASRSQYLTLLLWILPTVLFVSWAL